MTTKIYDKQLLIDKLQSHPDWSLGQDGMLHAEYTFRSFAQVMLFANAIAHLAEVADHHPDMCLHGYRHLSIRLMTHSAGGITDRDFALVAQIDALPKPV